MVDAVVSFVVEKIGDYIIQEAIFFRQVRTEVRLLKNELQWMQCFIKDAEEKQVDDPIIRQWVSDITNIAYDTEDVLDKYLLEGNDDESMTQEKPGFLNSIVKCTCLFDKGKEQITLYGIGKEIEDLRQRINDLSRKRGTYGLENIGNNRDGAGNALGRLKQLRRATSFAAEENIVGFEDDANELVAKLVDKVPERFIISIFGMGGLGKTTIARKLYHNSEVKKKFDCFAWVSVSQDYTIEDLLLRIINSFNMVTRDNLETMKEEDLERCLHQSLRGYSYLVVIDDVWQKEVWESLKRAFPENKNGSRVIVTTRIKEVAERSDERTHVHELRFLRPDESWKLFCEKAFRNSNADEGLENLGREMVGKCRGLPLVIVVLGGLLYTKKPQEWRIVRDHIWKHLRADSIQISYLLELSFNDLSYQLKLCFLYFSIFPEDSEINVERLIRLIVAEGFIQQNEDQIIEDVTRDCLNELVNRSLIQIDKRSWNKVATVRVHDLLRDLAIRKAEKLNFIHICDEVRNPTPSSVISSCRRQAVYSETPSSLWLQCGNPLSRSIFLFNYKWRDMLRIDQQLTSLFTRFLLSRVLDVEAAGYILTGIFGDGSIPTNVENLIHLRYVRLQNTRIAKVPPSIATLQRLQTLDLSDSVVSTNLPTEISKLKELRHLIGYFSGHLSIENLTNLQTLKCIEVKSWIDMDPSNLVNLRELHIEQKEGINQESFTFDSIAKLGKLQSLSVRLWTDHYAGSLEPLSRCPFLVDFRFKGDIELKGDMDAMLPNLECLSLKLASSKSNEDPMRLFEKLPNLVILDLQFYSKHVNKLICTSQGFRRLEILQLDCEELWDWQVDEEAMPVLRGLRFSVPRYCRLKIPDRLRSIPPPADWEFKEN